MAMTRNRVLKFCVSEEEEAFLKGQAKVEGTMPSGYVRSATGLDEPSAWEAVSANRQTLERLVVVGEQVLDFAAERGLLKQRRL
jgi:hypothetical protein